MFGIALCFLAALFFVEAKTAWVVIGNHSPIDIASAKAQTADRGLAITAHLQIRQPANNHSAPTLPAHLALAALLLAPPRHLIELLAGRGLPRISACFPFAHFNRPPPAL